MSNPLVGTWRLISWHNRSADGTISHPLSEDAVGFIVYTADGYMAGFLSENVKETDFFTDSEIQSGSSVYENQVVPGTYYVMPRASAAAPVLHTHLRTTTK
jgi:hypothetical protein